MKIIYNSEHHKHNPPYEGYTPEKLLPSMEKAERAEIVLTALRKTSWAKIQPPGDFNLDPILAVHSQDYLEYLRTAYEKWQVHSPVPEMAFIPGTSGIDYPEAMVRSGTEQHGFFLLDTTVAINTHTYPAALKSAHCALHGAQAITEGDKSSFALCRPPGHHAGRKVCGGYCFLNNAAIAAQWLSRLGKVAILDVDYHAGNGTQEIFYERADVLTISLHADPAFEYPRYAGFAHETGLGTGEGFHRNFPLPIGTEIEAYCRILEQALNLIGRFAPKFLVISAGMDVYAEEHIGTFKITQKGIHQIGAKIAEANLPTLIVMEGGYHLPTLGDNFAAFLESFT